MSYIKILVSGKNLNELKQALLEAGHAIQTDRIPPEQQVDQELVAKSMKERAAAQLKEEASIHEMYQTSEPVDNSGEFVDNDTPAPRGIESSLQFAAQVADGLPSRNLQMERSQPAQHPTGEVDSRGLPYDARIHSSSKAMTKDGSWRYRRNLPDGMIEKVEAELRGALSQSNGSSDRGVDAASGRVPQPVAAQPALNPFTSSVLAAPQPMAQQFFQPPVQVPVQQPVAVPQATPAQPATPEMTNPFQSPLGSKPVHNLQTFTDKFLEVMGELSMSGKLTQDYISKLNAYFGVAHIWELKKDPAKVAQVFDQFSQLGLITRV